MFIALYGVGSFFTPCRTISNLIETDDVGELERAEVSMPASIGKEEEEEDAASETTRLISNGFEKV